MDSAEGTAKVLYHTKYNGQDVGEVATMVYDFPVLRMEFKNIAVVNRSAMVDIMDRFFGTALTFDPKTDKVEGVVVEIGNGKSFYLREEISNLTGVNIDEYEDYIRNNPNDTMLSGFKEWAHR